MVVYEGLAGLPVFVASPSRLDFLFLDSLNQRDFWLGLSGIRGKIEGSFWKLEL